MQTYVASFQTDIIGSPSATSDVWLEYDKDIPSSKDFTVCHWIKVKFYDNDIAAYLWSYCTIQREGQKIECLQVCLEGVAHTANRDLEFNGEIKLRNYDCVKIMRTKLNHYQHITWSHLCWSFSSITGIIKFHQNGGMVRKDILDVAMDDWPTKASHEMNDAALIFGQDPDSMRGGFNKGQAYLGELSEFQK